jgi:hypothetical protein
MIVEIPPAPIAARISYGPKRVPADSGIIGTLLARQIRD